MSKQEMLRKALGGEAATTMAKDFLSFVNEAVTPFHAVASMRKTLESSGYVGLLEGHAWPKLAPGGKYYVTRNDSSIVAFSVGGKYVPGNGMKITGAHTDSPNLALKPRAAVKKGGFQGVAVQPYGGGLWHTWFDRDLTVAGRVLIHKKGASQVTKALVNLEKPILRIPNLCIHLRPAGERDKNEPHKQNHVLPFLSTEAVAEAFEEQSGLKGDAIIQGLLAKAAGCDVEEIIDFDLSVIDTQPAALGGVYEEFIMAPRIDNLMSCFCCLKAQVDADATLEDDTMVRMVAMFDNEECGSASSQGAGGSLIPDILNSLSGDLLIRSQEVANSFLLSVDGAHAAHPNYMDKHEDAHRPLLHQGPVIKYNANQRYATTGATAATVKALGKLADVPIQEFVIRNESPCGSTIGPILTTLSGIKGVDLGNAMLSMHSIREQCGTLDILYMYQLVKAFYVDYGKAKVDETPL